MSSTVEKRLSRLERNDFWRQRHSDGKGFSIEAADREWEENEAKKAATARIKEARDAKDFAERSKFQLEEYQKTFMEVLQPVFGGTVHDWNDKVVYPGDPETVFEFKCAIGSGSYYPDREHMKREIIRRWLNNSLHFWFITGLVKGKNKDVRWEFDITYRLREVK
jgi:hypothetical protein